MTAVEWALAAIAAACIGGGLIGGVWLLAAGYGWWAAWPFAHVLIPFVVVWWAER